MKSGRFLVGLTGGIGAGKSLALREFARLGAETLSLDEISRSLTRRGRAGHRAVIKAFGPKVLGPAREIDRPKLAAAVFSDSRARRKLERALHPLILREMRRRLRAVKRGVAVVDVPLLFEVRAAGEFDATLLVTAGRAARIARVAKRDGLKAVQISARIDAQMPESRKRRLADVVLDNDGTPAALKRKLDEYYRALDLISKSKDG